MIFASSAALWTDAKAQSARARRADPHSETIPTERPVGLAEPAESTDAAPESAGGLNGVYDRYLAYKNKIRDDAGLQFEMPVSVFGQWGSPAGGPGVASIVYSPTVTWTPFTDTAIGSGAFTFAFQGNQFWTRANTNSQQARMGLLTAPNDWGANGYQYTQITYTHTLPGNWLAVSVGQYSFAQYDGNQYAGNAQTNFIGYALAQNATQTYANAGIGGYVQITPTSELQFAGGFQGATDITGGALTTPGLSDGRIAYFLAAQWTPTYLAGGTYSVLYYRQPSVPLQPSASQGISFSAVQNIDATYGLFLRVNNASGSAIPIQTSVAFGGIVNDPLGVDRPDQAGIGVAWDKTNKSVVGEASRGSEFVVELYYSYAVLKALQITPDVQVYINPALAPSTRLGAILSIRTTINF